MVLSLELQPGARRTKLLVRDEIQSTRPAASTRKADIGS